MTRKFGFSRLLPYLCTMNLQRNIKRILKERDLTQRDIAERLGVSASSLSMTLSNNPTVTTLEQIATAIGCGIADFFTEEKKEEESGTVCPRCGARLRIVEE